jgi:hypothetical protein
MKTIDSLGHYLTRVTLVAVVAVLALFPLRTLAQEKGAERLMKLQRLHTVADVQKVEAGDTIVMSCPKCKDTWITVVQKTGKAAHPTETKAVQRHECPGCDTRIVTEGVGKQAKNVVKHTCKQCGSADAYCCVIKKGAGPTEGMVPREEPRH